MFHDRTKHVDIKYHFIRDIISKWLLKINKIPTLYNPSNMGTKVIPLNKFQNYLKMLSIDSFHWLYRYNWANEIINVGEALGCTIGLNFGSKVEIVEKVFQNFIGENVFLATATTLNDVLHGCWLLATPLSPRFCYLKWDVSRLIKTYCYDQNGKSLTNGLPFWKVQ